MPALADLIAHIGRHAPADGTYVTPIPGVTLIRASAPTLPMPVIYLPTLCLVAQGTKQASLGSTAYRYDPAHHLVASVELPVMGSVIAATPEHPYLCLQLDLDAAALSELALEHPAAARPSPHEAGLMLNATTPPLLDAAVRLVGLLDQPQDIAALAPLAIREIHYRLLTGPGGGAIRHLAQADSRLNQIARAIVWIRAHYRQACRIEDAAAQAGMSRSTFHLRFKAVTGMSPLAFRTQLRLHEARRLMVSDALDAAHAGHQVGYDSPSQFSRDYVRAFGMPPARHAQRLRQELGQGAMGAG